MLHQVQQFFSFILKVTPQFCKNKKYEAKKSYGCGVRVPHWNAQKHVTQSTKTNLSFVHDIPWQQCHVNKQNKQQ